MLISGTENSEHALDLDFQQLQRAPLLKLHPMFSLHIWQGYDLVLPVAHTTRQKPHLAWPEKGKFFLQSVEKMVFSTESVSSEVCVFCSPVGIQVLE